MQKHLPALGAALLLMATATVAQAQAPAYRLLVAQDQIYRANAWKDTLRYTRSGFVPGTALAQDTLKESSPNGGTSYTAVRFNRRRFNATGGLTSDTLFSYSATGVRSARAASTYSYNAQGRRSMVVTTFRLSTTFNPYGRDTYTYDAQGRLTRLLYESANGPTAYTNSSQVLYTYNALGQLVLEEAQNWNGTSQFTPADRYIRTYTATGQLAQETSESVVTFGGTTYVPVRRETYTYATTNPAQLVRTAIELPATSGGTLALAGQILRTYDANGNADLATTQRYSAATAIYTNLYRTVFAYQRVLATAPARSLNAGLSLAPNPATAGRAAVLRYTLPAAAPVAVDVRDALGRPVLCLPVTAQAAGEHTLALPALPLAPGLYLVRLAAGPQSQTVKLVVE